MYLEPEGPDFEEFDEVWIVGGLFDGKHGEVRGFDPIKEQYAVQLDSEAIWRLFSVQSIELDEMELEDEVDLLDPIDEVYPNDRIVVIYGNFLGEAGLVVRKYDFLGKPVVDVVLDNGVHMAITESGVERSIYQGEELEEVPVV